MHSVAATLSVTGIVDIPTKTVKVEGDMVVKIRALRADQATGQSSIAPLGSAPACPIRLDRPTGKEASRVGKTL